MHSETEPDDALSSFERPPARLESSIATRLSHYAGDRAVVVSSRSCSRSRSRSSRACGRFGWGSAFREIQDAEIQAASRRLEAAGVSARQLRAVAAELGGYSWRKAGDISAAMETRSERAIVQGCVSWGVHGSHSSRKLVSQFLRLVCTAVMLFMGYHTTRMAQASRHSAGSPSNGATV